MRIFIGSVRNMILYGGFTPWLSRVFRSFLNHVSKPLFYVRRDSYVATRPKTISFPFTQAGVGFRYIYAFKNRYLDYVDCYTTYTFYSPHHSGVNGLLYIAYLIHGATLASPQSTNRRQVIKWPLSGQ